MAQSVTVWPATSRATHGALSAFIIAELSLMAFLTAEAHLQQITAVPRFPAVCYP